MRVPAILYEFGQLKMGVVLIKWVWPKIFRAHYCYNPTIVIILDPPLNVFNIAPSHMSVVPRLNDPIPNSESNVKPFVLKIKTNQIRVYQSCRKDYNGPNDTMELLVARAERLVSNLVTGTRFLGRESNSHYHLHMSCLKLAKSSFTGEELVIPDEIKSKLTAFQKVYLITCIQVPPQSL